MNPNSEVDTRVLLNAGDPPEKLQEKYRGNNNRGERKRVWLERLQTLTDDVFVKEAETSIWLSAYANNNPRSDYHWQADACYDEAKRRGKPELYKRAFQKARASI